MTQHILIVDDDAGVRDAYELALEDMGAELLIADCGEKAMQLVESVRPNLVFLDLKMPGMDGVETLHALNQKHPALSVYIVTAFAREFMDRLREARTLGLQFQVASKPLGREQLQSIARMALMADSAGDPAQ